MDWMKFVPKLPRLSAGSHDEGSGLMCAAEMVAFLERLPHSDSPECTCPVIISYVRVINDNMDDASRQMLLPYLPRLVDTVSPEHEQARAEAIALHAINHIVPAVMDGIIPESLVAAMRGAETLDAGAHAATRAAHAATRAADLSEACAVGFPADLSAAFAAHAAARAEAVAASFSASHAATLTCAAGHEAAHAAACAAAHAADLSEICVDDLSEACAAGFPETCAAALSAARAAGFSETCATSHAASQAVEIWPLALEGLERMLAIGPRGRTTFDKERVEELIHTGGKE